MRAFSLLVLALCGGCLPVDTRPPPAEVTVTTSSSQQTREGIAETVDGYSIEFERVLIDVGQPYVGDNRDDGGSCSEYSSANYTRLFDFVAVTAPEEVGLAYALGTCPFEFVVRFPNLDAKLGTGASDADREFMRTAADDAYSNDAGVSVYVIGSATRDAVTKHFAWPFRERIGYENCWVPAAEGAEQNALTLESGGHAQVNLEMQAEALFRDQFDPDIGMLRFQPFADADTDGDGQITLDELDHLDLENYWPLYQEYTRGSAQPNTSVQFDCADSDGNPVQVKTLGDYAYCVLAPSIARYEGAGFCDVFAGRRRR
jgi:hypothetical protein